MVQADKKKSLESRMRSVSLDVSASKGHLSTSNNKANVLSQYDQNYKPMAKGLRIQSWYEGYQQRCERKKNGFNHFKLEWIVPTDRR